MILKFGLEVEGDLTPEVYKNTITQDYAYYDLAVLFEIREDQQKADEFWDKLPLSYKMEGLGGDYVLVSV